MKKIKIILIFILAFVTFSYADFLNGINETELRRASRIDEIAAFSVFLFEKLDGREYVSTNVFLKMMKMIYFQNKFHSDGRRKRMEDAMLYFTSWNIIRYRC